MSVIVFRRDYCATAPGRLAAAFRRLAAVAFCGAACAAVGVPARAASDTGEITIAVVDSVSAKPIGDARTILLGPQTASSLTSAAGIIHYTEVPVGIYRVRVARSGYVSTVSAEFDVLGDRAVNVRVVLALGNGGLKTIGSVVARSTTAISSNDIGDNSPVRRLSDSLTDALDKVAGVSVTQDATDPSGAVTVSLNGHDESQTSVSLDGIPLSAPGSAANLRSIGTDLFSGSSVSHSPGAGSLGGGINFRTLQPTQSLQVHANGTTGTFDRSNYQLAATGSLGSVGLAVQHTWRGSNSPLTFRDYQDQSGLTYPHEGESHSLGDFLKFRYRLGDARTTVSGTALTNNFDVHSICARDLTLLPCGIGPNNQSYSRYGFAYGTVASLVGSVATTVSAYESLSQESNENVNRYVLLPSVSGVDPQTNACGSGAAGLSGAIDYTEQLCPSVGNTSNLTRGIAYSATIAQGRHTFALSGNTYAALRTSHPTAGSRFESSFTNAISSSSYQIADTFKSSDALSLSPRLSIVNTTSLGTSLLGGFAATWRPQAADTFAASIDVGSSQANVEVNRSFSDPVSAGFDCAAGTALVNGPGDSNGGAQSAFSLNTSWTHQFARSGAQVSLAAFSQTQSGQLINASIAEPSSFFAPGYLSTLRAAFAAQSVCGATAPAPAVYVNESVAGTRRVYQGITASGRIGIGRYFVALPNYTLNVAKLTAASPRLNDGPSTTIVGEQLPNRPIHRAGVTFDGVLPRSGIELLLNAQYTGSNNPQRLGQYTIFAAGILHNFGPGRFTLFENNVFNTYGGDFVTDANAQPLPLSNGGIFRTAATPLTPRVLNLSYSVALGGARPGPALSVARPGPARGVASAQETEPSPSGSATPRALRVAALPPPPGVDPLSLATSRAGCDADTQATAKPVFEAIRAYVTAYEAKSKVPDVPNVEIISHVAQVDPTVPYYLELRPRKALGQSPSQTMSARSETVSPDIRELRRGGAAGPVPPASSAGGSPAPGPSAGPAGGGGRALRGLAGCAYLTVLANAEAKAKGIATDGGRPGLFYVPKTGFVFVRAPELPQGGGSLKNGS